MDSSKKHERMSDVVNTSVPELSELASPANVSEAVFGGTMLPDEPQSLTCMSAARHFGATGAAIHGLTPGAILGDPLAAKHFYDRGGGGGGGGGGGEWEGFTSAESSPGGTLSLSTPGACKFIKDEKESAVIRSSDGSCPNFDQPPDGAALDGIRKQQQQTGGTGDGDPAVSFTPRPGLDTSQNFVIELDQPDSRCGFSERSAANFDNGRNPAQQLPVFKNEAPRWQTPTADSQFWCQVPAAVTEDPFGQSGYEGGQNQLVAQRNMSPSFTFQG